MVENFPNIWKIQNLQMLRDKVNPNRGNMKKITQRHSIIELLRPSDKAKFFKRHLTFRELNATTTADFSSEIMKVGRKWSENFKNIKHIKAEVIH